MGSSYKIFTVPFKIFIISYVFRKGWASYKQLECVGDVTRPSDISLEENISGISGIASPPAIGDVVLGQITATYMLQAGCKLFG